MMQHPGRVRGQDLMLGPGLVPGPSRVMCMRMSAYLCLRLCPDKKNSVARSRIAAHSTSMKVHP